MKTTQNLVFIDGSHYDRLRDVLGTPLDLQRLVRLVTDGKAIEQAVYYRDRRDEAEEQRLKKLFRWLEHSGFTVKSRRHERTEPRERYGSNLIEMAVDALEMGQPGLSMFMIAGDKKLAPLFDALRSRGVHVTLISTLDAPATIAPPDVLLDAVDDFIELADMLDEISASGVIESI